MSDYKVNIVVAVQDKASGPLGAIGKSLGGLGGLAKGALIGGVAAGAAAIAGLGAVLVSSTKDAMAAQEVQAQLAAVLESTGGVAGVTAQAALDYADAMAKVTRFDDEAILSGENLLLTFTSVGEDVFPTAMDAALDMSQAMGQDLNASILQIGKALNDPIQGMTALRRVGVQFTDEQEVMIQKMVEAGDVMGAQKLILQELGREFGGSARAAGQTFAGQMDILKTQLGNVKEQIGAALLPALKQLAQTMGPQLVAAAQTFADWFSSTGGPALETLFNWVATNLPPAFAALASLWRDTLFPALQTVGNWIQTNLVPVLELVWTWLATNIPPVVAAMATFWQNTLLPALQTVGNWIQTNLVPVLQKIWEWLGVTLPPVLQGMADLWNNVLLPSMRAVWSLLSDYVFPILKAIADVVGAVLNVALQVLGEIFTKIIAPVFERVASILKENLGPAFETGASIVGIFKGALEGLGGIIDGIVSALERLADKIRNLPKLNLPDIPGFASGTLAAPGGMAWVGERGPELVSLPRGSQVYPAGQSRAMAQRAQRAAPSWNVTINVSGANDPRQTGREVELGMLRAARSIGSAW